MANIPFPEDKTGPALFKNYLQKRGILANTVDSCGLELTSTDTAIALINPTFRTPYRQCVVIPYLGTDFAVARVLGEPAANFGTLTNKKYSKMISPKGRSMVYTPPLVDWEKFNGTLYICESAIKAIGLAQYGHAAIAGSGVSTVYTKAGFTDGWPADLMDSGSVERVVILFDADWQTNVQVAAAIRRLATGINRNYPGIPVTHKQLPLLDGEALGIDDWLYREGPEWLNSWLASDEDEEPVEVSALGKHLDELNERYVLTRQPSMLIDRLHRSRVVRADFTDMLESGRCFMEKVEAGKSLKWVEVHPAKEWLKWKDRNIKELRAYNPGGDEFGDKADQSYYNTWYDDGAKAEHGDIEPFLRVYQNAIPNDIERQLLIESLAWIMQNRGTRLEKCFVLVGADQGTGKSLLVETMGELVGDSNFASISPHNFANNFNNAIIGREIVLMDDVGSLQTNSKGQFKNFVTGKTFMAEHKGKDAYKMVSSAVLFITTNEFASVPLDPEDRRAHVCAFEPTVHYEQGHTWWIEYISWLQGGGYGILRQWLEGLDISTYNPNFMPPMTATKLHMDQSRKDDIENWVDSLWADKDAELLGNKRAFYTVDELAMIYHGGGWGGLEEKAKGECIGKLGQHLAKRFKRVGRNAIRTAQGRQRFWGIRVDGGGVTSNKVVVADVKKYATLKLD